MKRRKFSIIYWLSFPPNADSYVGQKTKNEGTFSNILFNIVVILMIHLTN
jgi:hypothetical protein